MALTISQAGSNNSTTSGATLGVTVTAAVGDVLVVMVAADNQGTSGASSISSVLDSAGNSYNQRAITNRTAGSVAGDGATMGIFTCQVTAALTAGTVTVNFSPNTAAKAAIIYKLTPSSGKQVNYVGVGSGLTGNTNGISLACGTINSGDTVFCAVAAEFNSTSSSDTDTSNGSWSSQWLVAANTGSATTSMTVISQYKTVTGTGAQTWDVGTWGNQRDNAGNYIVFDEAAAPFVAGNLAMLGM